MIWNYMILKQLVFSNFYNIFLSNIDSKKVPSNISSKMISRRHNKSKKVIDLSKEGNKHKYEI